MDATTSTNLKASPRTAALLANLAHYFRDFLDTDFKRGYVPKRRVTHKDRNNNLTSISLRRYPGLAQLIWQRLRLPVGEGLEITINRGRFRSELDKTLANYIDQHIEAINPDAVTDLIQSIYRIGRELTKLHKENPAKLKDSALTLIERETVKQIIVPLLKKLEPQLELATRSGFEVAYDIEDELGDMLVASNEEAIGAALNNALVTNRFDQFDTLIDSLLNRKAIQIKLQDYFDVFKVSDVFNELLELRNTLKLIDNSEIYLYIGDIHTGKSLFPAFYLSLEIAHESNSLILRASPHLYVNKRGIDYLAQEIVKAEKRTPPVLVRDRILYLSTDQKPIEIIQHIFDHWISSLNLREPIDCSQDKGQIARSSLGAISNRLHFAVSDKADEALINDFEQLLAMSQDGTPVYADFTELIESFLTKDPISVAREINEAWSAMPIEDRLVYESPIPLNEEQRKVAMALRSPDVRFVAVTGPPGTGKSHLITSIAFDAILKGRNVLVLSDKTEALDVVEDKLTQTLNSVRIESDFQNPLLRLGKTSTYSKILSAQSIERLTRQHHAAIAHRKDIEAQRNQAEEFLRVGITQTIARGKVIDLKQVSAFEKLEADIEAWNKDIAEAARRSNIGLVIDKVNELVDLLREDNGALLQLFKVTGSVTSLSAVESVLALKPIEEELKAAAGSTEPLLHQLFKSMPAHGVDLVAKYCHSCLKLHWPIFGFLFTRNQVRMLDVQLAKQVALGTPEDFHRRYKDVIRAYYVLDRIRQVLNRRLGNLAMMPAAYALITHGITLEKVDVSKLQNLITGIRNGFSELPELKNNLGLEPDRLDDWLGLSTRVEATNAQRVLKYRRAYSALVKQFEMIPKVDYAGNKAKLESLYTRQLADSIDERVVEFYEKNRITANSIKSIIKSKAQFPLDKFEELRKAFPCMIADIRTYSEFVPLERDLFDIIVIDEGSQVSLAQCFPAILRAKKLVVLGDRNQFSNVKTTNASIEINNQYVNDIRRDFQRFGPIDTNVFARLKKFDIKTSALDFVDMVANFGTMLTKHFRSYPELISFSSKYFYGNSLQAVKLRGKPIEDVIEFNVLEDDKKQSLRGNVNEIEADFIEQRIEALLDLEEPPTVGIITPFTDQQRYLTRRLTAHSKYVEFSEKLRLKIMTFDSAQGEERDLIFYSIVANTTKDRLWGVFPKAIRDAGDIETVLRLQRLNVGFSRAKEKIHFVLSKPIESFQGSTREVLNHYFGVLERTKQMPGFNETDPASPMENMVLQWIYQGEFYEKYGDAIEVIPQYPIGDYLRQLDPYYEHPSYRVDFLLRLHTESSTYSIIIEYDGFKEHFIKLDEITTENYRAYYKPEDVEREKILESYGYRILRINRFNLGDDPAQTLSARLDALVDALTDGDVRHHLISEMNTTTEALKNGEKKRCPKCKEIKAIEEFHDASLKTGKSRNCKACRKTNQSMRTRNKWRRNRW